jgi:anaerobic magnesium-protoporphyrin IX monomethyl ester cyclase
MRVLLINPPTGFSYGILGISRPPLGLAYIASVLRTSHEVEMVDFCVDKRDWSSYPYHDFDVVGISVDTTRAGNAFKIAECAKRRGATVVMGGPHVSFLDEEALSTGVADYVVRKEGEYSLLSLVDFLSGRIGFDQVRGVSYLADGRCNRTPPTPLIRDLDSLPFPARDLLPMSLYREKMNGRPTSTLVTSRGCPFDCEFCSASQFFGAGWRARSPENILEEVRLLYEDYGYRALSFVDDNFTLDPRRAVAVSEMILARGWDLVWAAMTRVDTIVKNPHMIEVMARSGFSWSFIGFESGTQEALDGYGKKAQLEDAVKAMEILKQNRVAVTGAFILGAPTETREMIRQTIKFAKRLDPRRAQFSILTPYPGTRLYDTMKHRLLSRDWEFYSGLHPTMELDHISAKELRRLHIEAYASFYGRPRKALQNLSYIFRILPSISGYLGLRLVKPPAKAVSHPILFAKKCLAIMQRHLS